MVVHRVDPIRRSAGELENLVLGGFLAGRLSRRDLLRRGSIARLSLPALS